MCRSFVWRDRGLTAGRSHELASPISERTGASSGRLCTAFLTSPLLLPIALALLMGALRGTPVGSALLQHLHLVYIGSVVYCLAALAATYACYRPTFLDTQFDPPSPGPGRSPDLLQLELQAWLVAHGRHAEDVPTTDRRASSDPPPIDFATYSQAPRTVAQGG